MGNICCTNENNTPDLGSGGGTQQMKNFSKEVQYANMIGDNLNNSSYNISNTNK